MDDLLNDLLLNYVEHTHELYVGDQPGCQEALQTLSACEREIEAALGRDFLNRWQRADYELGSRQDAAYFRAGFRLGGRLVLALMSSGPPDRRASPFRP